MGEAEKVEHGAVRVRMTCALRPIDAKVDEMRLVGVELEPVPCKPLTQHVHDPFGIFENLECHHAIIGVPHEDAVPLEAWPHVLLEPVIQHMVQVNVCEQGRYDATLWGAFGRVPKEIVLKHARLQPFVDNPTNNSVRESSVEKRTQVMMLDGVVVLGDIDVPHPAQTLPAHEAQTQCTQGLMCRPSRPALRA